MSALPAAPARPPGASLVPGRSPACRLPACCPLPLLRGRTAACCEAARLGLCAWRGGCALPVRPSLVSAPARLPLHLPLSTAWLAVAAEQAMRTVVALHPMLRPLPTTPPPRLAACLRSCPTSFQFKQEEEARKKEEEEARQKQQAEADNRQAAGEAVVVARAEDDAAAAAAKEKEAAQAAAAEEEAAAAATAAAGAGAAAGEGGAG